MGRLFVAEKPRVAKAIAECLPGSTARHDGYFVVGEDIVSWCFGHLLELKDAYEYNEAWKSWNMEVLPIFPEQISLRPRNDAGAKKQISVIGQFANKVDEVINAGDPDREGHLLVMEVLEHVKCKRPVKRMWLNATDKDSVKKALGKLTDNRLLDGLLASGKARSQADWLVGINLSRCYTKAFNRDGSARLVTVGRVQSPVLAMVVERDLLVESFVAQTFFVPKILLEKVDGLFWAVWVKHGDVGFDVEGRLISKEIANAALPGNEHNAVTVISAESELKEQGAPKLFSLGSLQAFASNKYGFAADKTLELAQSLYDKHRLLSYPRSDCHFLPESQHADAPKIIASLGGCLPSLAGVIAKADSSIVSKAFDDKKVTAHHAIIPVVADPQAVAALNDDEMKLYEMVVRRYLSHFYPPYLYEATVIVVEDPDKKQYRASGTVPVKDGWRVAEEADIDLDEANDDEDNQGLPKLVVGETLSISKRTVDVRKTKKPRRYTDGTLVMDMTNVHRVIDRRIKAAGGQASEKMLEIMKRLKECAGIGTEATRGNMIKGLVEKEYLSRKGKNLISTELGREVIKNLPEKIKSPIMTALFEQALDAIAEGKMEPERFIEGQKRWIVSAIDHARAYKMDVAPYVRESKAGGPKANGSKPGTSGTAQSKQGNKPPGAWDCPKCKGGWMLLRKSSKPGAEEFFGCSKYPECKHTEKGFDPSIKTLNIPL
jgi:DNA topoisomerase-3